MPFVSSGLDQVLKRERSALSESSTGAQGSNTEDPTAAVSSSTTTSQEANTIAMWSSGIFHGVDLNVEIECYIFLQTFNV